MIMTENPKLEQMGSHHNPMSSNNCESGELGERGAGLKICVSDNVNGLQHHPSAAKSDSFVVDMERFSHLTEKDMNANSRITLQRNLSRKGSARSGEKKIIATNERDTTLLATSPRATLHGGSTPEKPVVVVMGPTDHSTVPQLHHQISFTNGTVGSECGGKRFSFRRSSHTWTTDPRRILLFFATLSCVGTIVLIYFTLSIGKLSGDDTALN
ncbi:uncharacterized protein LOC105175383 isoform X1 [Sesamum indicum]|uniref:Uncharacterized protein LOC105175383 isoform X1 n=1 Tax=Sesamum indicum TaxID=4182 RepID=A0A6I9U9C2_SESIN|nr:uncharacterized protein LOC105175383 isoform X1 [Sesamum indicum]